MESKEIKDGKQEKFVIFLNGREKKVEKFTGNYGKKEGRGETWT